jgi:hypothetical protein
MFLCDAFAVVGVSDRECLVLCAAIGAELLNNPGLATDRVAFVGKQQ